MKKLILSMLTLVMVISVGASSVFAAIAIPSFQKVRQSSSAGSSVIEAIYFNDYTQEELVVEIDLEAVEYDGDMVFKDTNRDGDISEGDTAITKPVIIRNSSTTHSY